MTSFKRLHQPGKDICVDEAIIGFKGRVPFRVYMPNKPKKFGMKVWLAVDTKSLYVWNADMYLGKPRSGSEANLGQKVRGKRFKQTK